MERTINVQDHIAIAQLAVFAPCFVAAVYLGLRHGFWKSSGWYFLIVLTLARIIGSSFRLATISDAKNVSLYVGWMILNNVGLSPLILALLGLIGRIIEGIRRNGQTLVESKYRKLIDTLLLVAMIVGIVGGTNSTYTVTAVGTQVQYDELVRVSVGLTIGGFVLLVLEALLVLFRYNKIEDGEHRLLVAVFLALPFVLVRLIYSCLKVFGNSASSTLAYFMMSVLMEMIAVVICLGFGLTLRVVPQPPKGDRYEMVGLREETSSADNSYRARSDPQV